MFYLNIFFGIEKILSCIKIKYKISPKSQTNVIEIIVIVIDALAYFQLH